MENVERKQPGKGRKNRVGVSLETAAENDLKKLAVSCGMSPTTLSYLLLKFCLRNTDVVNIFQNKYNKIEDYWVFHYTAPDGKRRLEIKR